VSSIAKTFKNVSQKGGAEKKIKYGIRTLDIWLRVICTNTVTVQWFCQESSSTFPLHQQLQCIIENKQKHVVIRNNKL